MKDVITSPSSVPEQKNISSAYTAVPMTVGRALFFSLLIGVVSAMFACNCDGPPPLPDGGNDGGTVLTPDERRTAPPANWAAQKMKKGETCGTFKWGDLSCDDGLVCVKTGSQGMCLQSCDPNGAACPNSLPCQEAAPGTWACLTNEKLTADGQECAALPCQPPLSCVRASYEQKDSCRPPCDPHPDATNTCADGFICGILPAGGGSCVPRPEGSVDEFGKCGGTNGICKGKPIDLKCVFEASRDPIFGSCLRPCSDTLKCPDDLVCVKSVGACAKTCDLDAPNCSYGTCNGLPDDKSVSVCY